MNVHYFTILFSPPAVRLKQLLEPNMPSAVPFKILLRQFVPMIVLIMIPRLLVTGQ